MKGVEVHYRAGRRFTIRQARLRDMMASDPERGNPMLWWCEEITPGRRDWLCAGVYTKRECLEAINESIRSR